MNGYDDLQLRIDRDADGSYRVLATAPDGRTARGSFRPPISDLELDDFVQRVGLARRRRGSADDRMQAIRELGSTLFDALIREDVGTVYYSARSAASERERGLRITLRLSGSPELMRLPWEFLYKRPRFIAQSTMTPVVRALDVDSAPHPHPVRLPLRILAMVSSPSGYPELDADAERRNLERALEGPRRAGLVELTWLDRATLGELGRRIAEPDAIHVLHYIGHGAYDEATESGVLVLETPQGRAHDVSGEDIGAMLQDEASLRLVVLNACEGARTSHVDPFSGVATSLVNFDIPAVIGMQFEITDDAAIAFSESLYTGLARGLPVDAALAPARRAIIGAMVATEFGTPVLFLRDGDARLFEIAEGAVADDAVAAPPVGAEPGFDRGPEPAGVEAEPAEAEPIETESAEAESVEAAPTEAEPVEAEPVEAEPVEAEPVEAEPIDAAPTEAVPVEAAPIEADLHPIEPTEGKEEPEATDAAAVRFERPDRDDLGEPGVPAVVATAMIPAEPPIVDRASRPSTGLASVVSALIGAGLLAVTAFLFFANASQPNLDLVRLGFIIEAAGLAALCAHYLARPNRDGMIPAVISAAAAVLLVVVAVGLGRDFELATWSHLLFGSALVVMGVWLLIAGRAGGSAFTASLRIPAIPLIIAGGIDVVSEVIWLNGGWPQPNWLWPLGVLGMAAGYAGSSVVLARELRDGPDLDGSRVGAPGSDGTPIAVPVEESSTDAPTAAPVRVAEASAAHRANETATSDSSGSTWTADVTYERMARRPTRATVALRLTGEHVLVLEVGAGWKTIEVDGTFVPIPRGRIAEFPLRDLDVDRACVLESSPPAAGDRPESPRNARIESLVVDGVSIPLEQSAPELGG